MHFIESTIFGAVQGVTEFLPISSSGHLSLLHNITHFSVGDDLAFDVALHLGTLLAILVYFWRDLWGILTAWLGSFRHWAWQTNEQQRLAWIIVLASVPAGLAGVFLESQVATVFRAPTLTAIVLIIAGVLLWLADQWAGQQRTIKDIGWWRGLLIGFSQAIALIPGVSRSGATITMGRALNLSREAAVKFSFLLSAPIMAAAGLKKLLDIKDITLTSAQRGDFFVGMVTSAVVGWLAISVLLKFIRHHSFNVFVWYRIVLGLVVLAVIYL